ncbi:MAG: SxtJ family membrane protein [Thermoanaerobaculia bacterium]|nr:SxtJ family membrane protein [Thermoanaerobaculia bacterium]
MMSIRDDFSALPSGLSEWRKFGLLVGAVFLAIGAFVWWRDVSWWVVPVVLGAPLVLLGAVFPRSLRVAYLGWMFLAVVLGFFVTRIILTVFFFLVITPVALFFKLIGRDALHRKLDREAETYWITKHYPIADRSRFEKFF